MKRSSIWGPIIGAAVVIGGVAAYRLANSEATPGDVTEVVTPATPAMYGESAEADASPAPLFTLKDVDGKTVSLADYKGKVVVLNFWATWCPPCRREIPDFNELQKQYGDKGLQFIGVALDEEGLAKVKPYVTANPINYPTLIAEKEMVAKYGELNAIPVTILIDRKGMIRTKYTGMRQRSVVESMIAPLLAEK